VKTGIQKDIARHDFWIPTYVGMTKRLKNNTYDTNPLKGQDGYIKRHFQCKAVTGPEGKGIGREK
jgi:hypothetical protein